MTEDLAPPAPQPEPDRSVSSEPSNQSERSRSAPEQTNRNRPPDKAPLRAWPYPSAQDVDLVYSHPSSFLNFSQVIGVIVSGCLIYLCQSNLPTVSEIWEIFDSPSGLIILGATFLFAIYLIYLHKFGKKEIYLVDFACWEPPKHLLVPDERYFNLMKTCQFFSDELCEFQQRLHPRAGLGQQTCFPPGILAEPPVMNMEAARAEFDLIAKETIDELLAKTGVTPKDIGILVVNCSLFNPTPSMCARIINLYKMNTDIQSYNLSGMGCSASVISVHLARDLLQIYPNTYALIFSTENITQNWYIGKEKSMLVQNSLFRCGGAAILLSNKPSLANKSKYALVDTYRAHLGAQDDAYECVYQLEDPEGIKGVRLSKEIMKIAERGLRLNLTYLGSLVLPFSEQLKYFLSMLKKRYGLTDKVYQPDFKTGIQHFCIHAGGRAIIDGLEKSLSLEEKHVAPSRATLYRYGNTSSSSIWYELQYIERSGKLVAGDVIWQIALGSGFKCNSGVWRSLKTVKNLKAC